MARLPPRQLNELAEDREKRAARCDRNAQSGRDAAVDPDNSPAIQAQAATAARFAEQHAREYREEAAALREGRIPGEDW